MSRLDRNSFDIIRIVDIKHTDVFIAATRHPWKGACLIAGDPTVSELDRHEDFESLLVVSFLGW